jgi:hypothetical protein
MRPGFAGLAVTAARLLMVAGEMAVTGARDMPLPSAINNSSSSERF